jgi:hypothetical protein
MEIQREALGPAVLNTNERRDDAALLAGLERVPSRPGPCWNAVCSVMGDLVESQTPRTHIKIQGRAGSGLDGVAHEASPVALPPANSATLAEASTLSG